MTMSTSPYASPSLIWLSCLRGVSRDAWAILIGRSLEALAERRVMLARQQRRRHHHRHLLAVHRRHEGGAQRHLGLAESDIAADQPVHRPARLQILEHRLRWRRADPRFPHRGSGRRTRHRGPSGGGSTSPDRSSPRRGSADQLVGNLPHPLLELGLAGLPGAAAQPVELDPGLVRAEARQKLDVLDRQEQPVAAGIERNRQSCGAPWTSMALRPSKRPMP